MCRPGCRRQGKVSKQRFISSQEDTWCAALGARESVEATFYQQSGTWERDEATLSS